MTMFAAAVLLSLASLSPGEPADAPARDTTLVIFVDRRVDETLGSVALSLASACQDVRPVRILARAQGRFEWVSAEGQPIERLPGGDLYSALSKSFGAAGWVGEVLYLGTHLPLGASPDAPSSSVPSRLDSDTDNIAGQDFGSTYVGFSAGQRPSYRFKRSLKDLRESGATFHAVAFRGLPDEGMTLLARESGGSIWKAGAQPEVPAEVIDRLCRL